MDHVLLDGASAADLRCTLAGLDVVLVGVRCPPEVLTRREAARGDRTIGQAVAQLPQVHVHGRYGVDVDTSVLSPQQAAGCVLDHLGRDCRGRARQEWRTGTG